MRTGVDHAERASLGRAAIGAAVDRAGTDAYTDADADPDDGAHAHADTRDRPGAQLIAVVATLRSAR
jgi:hypothetical protein